MPLILGLIAALKCYSRLLKYWAAKIILNIFTYVSPRGDFSFDCHSEILSGKGFVSLTVISLPKHGLLMVKNNC